MSSNWTEMFDKKPSSQVMEAAPAEAGEPEWAPPPDPKHYRPWLMQRGGRPAMFIDLRRFEPKTSTLTGCLMSYPALIAVDYIGDHMLSLDFGNRRFILEGAGLTDLAARLQQGMVLAIQEFSPKVWQAPPFGSVINKIVSVTSQFANKE